MLTILMALVLAAGAELEPRRCQIDVCVTRTDPAAPRAKQRERVVAEPRVVTQFGRPAFFRTGEWRPDGNELGLGKLVSGVELEVLPLLKSDGGIRLERRVKSVGGGRGSSVVRDLKSGEKYRFDGPEGYRIEVTVTEVAAKK